MFSADASEGIKLCPAIIFAGLPFCGDPAFLLKFVKRRVERAIANLQDVTGDQLQALADGKAVEGLKGQNFQKQKIQGALDEIGWLAHGSSCALLAYRG